MATPLDLRERHELCDLMIQVGPTAPTLCGDWTTFDLAAHLVVRERNPLSAPGIVFGGPFEGFTERLMRHEQRRGFEAVVARARQVPFGPLRIDPLRDAIDLIEYTVHHEDVRRPQGLRPREDRDDLQRAIWARVRKMAGLSVRRAKISPVRIELVATGAVDGAATDRTATAGKGDRAVTITGPPVELMLFLWGRQQHAVVDVEGDPADVEVARHAAFGI